DGVVLIAVADAVGPYETLTVAVGFEQGTFATFDSSYLASPLGWAQGVAGVGLVGAGVFAVRARRTALADEPGRPTIIAEHPPPGIGALESAVRRGRPAKATAAEVLEQAGVGSIRIIEGERGLFGRAPLIAELVDRSRADHDGRMLLDALFPAGTPGEQYTFG